MAPAGNVHGRISMNVSPPLDQHARATGLGVVLAAETGFRISANPNTVRAPDAALVRRERIEAEGYWTGAPDLSVEVISTTDRFSEVEEKVADWLAAGTRMVLVVNPHDRTVEVWISEKDARILSEHEVVDGGEVVPGWTLPVANVFR